MLFSTHESKDTLKSMKNYGIKSKMLFLSTSNPLHGSNLNSSDNYDEKYMKIKYNSDNYLPLKKTLKLYNTMVGRSVFHEGNHKFS